MGKIMVSIGQSTINPFSLRRRKPWAKPLMSRNCLKSSFLKLMVLHHSAYFQSRRLSPRVVLIWDDFDPHSREVLVEKTDCPWKVSEDFHDRGIALSTSLRALFSTRRSNAPPRMTRRACTRTWRRSAREKGGGGGGARSSSSTRNDSKVLSATESWRQRLGLRRERSPQKPWLRNQLHGEGFGIMMESFDREEA